MKTDIRLNLIGLEREEVEELVEKASIELGIEKKIVDQFSYFSKTFLQRRKIGGQEALIAVVLFPEHARSGASLFPMSAGQSVLIGIRFETPDNRSTASETIHIYSKSFETVGEALRDFDTQVDKVRQEALKEAPVEPKVSKRNFDPIEGVPANEVYQTAVRLDEVIRKAREVALNYCPNELLDYVLEEIEDLNHGNFKLRKIARKILDKQSDILRRM